MRAPWDGPARVLDGKATAAAIKAELARRVAALRELLDLQQGQLRLLWQQLQERDVREPRNPADEIPPHF